MSRLINARKAYRKRDIKQSKSAHTKQAISEKDIHGLGNDKYIGDLVLGSLDGMITTFAVVSGVAGASLSSGVVLILGFANLLADGLSMALGNYLGTKSEIEFYQNERKREEWEIRNYPKGEVEEIREIFRKKGFRGEDLEQAVNIVTSDKNIWLDTMMKDELGIIEDFKNPHISGLATFIAFVIFGFIPLIPYVLSYFTKSFHEYNFTIAVIITGVALFFVGSAKVYVTGKNWLRSGIEMLIIGAIAAFAAYSIGFLLKGLA